MFSEICGYFFLSSAEEIFWSLPCRLLRAAVPPMYGGRDMFLDTREGASPPVPFPQPFV